MEISRTAQNKAKMILPQKLSIYTAVGLTLKWEVFTFIMFICIYTHPDARIIETITLQVSFCQYFCFERYHTLECI